MDGAARARVADGLRWGGLCLMLIPAFVRAMSRETTLPRWEMDPMTFGSALVEIGPAGGLLAAGVMLVGAGLVLVGEWLGGRAVRAWVCALGVAGAVGVILHGWVVHGGAHIEHQRIGASWAAAVVCGVAIFHLCRVARFGRVVLALVLGFVMVLALRGAQQVLIEHPMTVEDYRQNREAVLAARGWSPDSAMARAYERRLMQAEATGWFGMANVYATFAALGAVTFLGLVAAAVWSWGGAGARWLLRGAGFTLPVGVVLAGVALALNQAKGGYVAVLGGVAAFVVLGVLRERGAGWPRASRIAGGLVGVGALVGPMVLVAARGGLGERIGELSLLFRWFYMQAAVKIGAENPLLGVGPAGFQSAYLLAKPPLSPEDAASPHNLVLDWWTMLGLAGVAWVALWVWWVWLIGWRAAGQGVAGSDAPVPDRVERAGVRGVLGIAAVATVIAALLEFGAATPDVALVRVGGLVLWCAVGVGLLAVLGRLPRAGLAVCAGALAAASHGQIDITGTWPPSAALLVAVIAAVAAGGSEAGSERERETARQRNSETGAEKGRDGRGTRGGWGWAWGGVVLGLAGFVLVAGFVPAWRWEGKLHSAAREVGPVTEVNEWLSRARRLAGTPEGAAALEGAVSALSDHLGERVGTDGESIELGLAVLIARHGPRAAGVLLEAAAMYPRHWRLRREASRLYVTAGERLLRLGRRGEALESLERAVEAAEAPEVLAAAPGAAWAGLVRMARHDLLGDAADLELAAERMERAAALDPYKVDYADRLCYIYVRLGLGDEARRWARRTLELDELARLDAEVRGLPERRRAELSRLVRGP